MTVKNFLVFWKKTWIVVWLALVYVLSLWLVLGALSSYQLQSRINSENAQNQTGNTVSAVLRQQSEIEILEDQIEISQTDIKDIKLALQDVLINARSLEKELDQLPSKLEMLWLRIIQSAELGLEQQASSPQRDCKRLKDILGSADHKGDDYQEISEMVNDTCERATYARTELPYKKREIAIKKVALQTFEFDLNKLKDDHSFLLKKNSLIRDYLTELKAMKKFHFDFLATMPGQLLTLMLTLSMGALGSIIYLTRALFDASVERDFTWYFFRPFLGMIMAMAIFVLVKAGQLTISSSGGTDDLSGLSPFFLSFVAIISGLLSEQAYQKIYLAGQNFLGVAEADTERWALNLVTAIQSRGRQPSELLLFLSATETELNDWISAAKPVPQQQQNIISAWLDMPSREIFSDQPPHESIPGGLGQANEDAGSQAVEEK